jgi:hypothetical protein
LPPNPVSMTTFFGTFLGGAGNRFSTTIVQRYAGLNAPGVLADLSAVAEGPLPVTVSG